jgi:hypothetical protein
MRKSKSTKEVNYKARYSRIELKKFKVNWYTQLADIRAAVLLCPDPV